MSKTRVLVTGSSGYIGSHTVKYLHQHGYEVFGLDREPPLKALAPYVSANCEADISDSGCVGLFIKKYQIEHVIHCAALCLVGESVEKPDMYFDNNVARSDIFLNTLIGHNVHSIIFSSTAATYGEPVELPIRESHPQNPINPYGQSKLDFEKKLMEAQSLGKIKVGIVRYFNAAGADPEGELGENHDPETHLIPNACRALLGLAPALNIFGNDYPTRDGTCERDYVHVMDLAQAHMKLVEKIMQTGSGGIYNLGLGSGYTINEVIQEIEKLTGKKVPKTYAPRRPGDPAKLVATAELAQKELGWTRELSDLPTIVKTALAWFAR